ncbi:hypothetical protein C8J57DRAFT_1257260 [Mycena rebaudengoi]|nr:hypothetical protein C8J57DRAFT_1257260 [Mycena rebaudengoi]
MCGKRSENLRRKKNAGHWCRESLVSLLHQESLVRLLHQGVRIIPTLCLGNGSDNLEKEEKCRALVQRKPGAAAAPSTIHSSEKVWVLWCRNNSDTVQLPHHHLLVDHPYRRESLVLVLHSHLAQGKSGTAPPPGVAQLRHRGLSWNPNLGLPCTEEGIRSKKKKKTNSEKFNQSAHRTEPKINKVSGKEKKGGKGEGEKAKKKDKGKRKRPAEEEEEEEEEEEAKTVTGARAPSTPPLPKAATSSPNPPLRARTTTSLPFPARAAPAMKPPRRGSEDGD